MPRTDEIDELVISVRNFVAHKDHAKTNGDERLVLKPYQRISAEEGAALAAAEAELAATFDAGESDDSGLLVLAQQNGRDQAGLEATIAELEAAVTAQSDDWEPDEGEDFAGKSAWATSAFDAPAEEEVEPEAVPAEEAELEVEAVATLDEDELRAFIVSVIREELGGELGERMTTNVRKLVRREINRVLTSRQLGED
ncbi:MAG: hypothetical protein ACSHW1_14475 [Yoonia sp.]|uniref:hypothetical protein n=1 Tax=Yoonia sp. TaxID=2212373 RepID=UPI003EF7ED23